MKYNPEKHKKGIWTDLGTGSGALAIGLARSFPLWMGHCVELSQDALTLAAKNIKNLVGNSSKVSLHLGDWWQPLKPWWGQIDLAIANPPYIPKANFNKLDPVVRNHEPHLALLGGEDGFECCKQIIKGAKDGLRSGGWLVFEHNFDHSERALALLAHIGFQKINFHNYLEGIKRFAVAQKP